MDPKIAKKTQDTLGKIIKKPPLTDKLLAKPPFRFLHDIVTSVIKTTGFMKGLHAENELNSENVKDKDSKIAFLQKVIDYVSMVSGKSVTAKPGKIVAGHEPEKTNELLVVLAHAINKQVDNDEYMKKFKNKDSSGGEEKKDKEKERSKRREKESDEKEGKDREEKKHREKSRDGDRERKEKRDKSKHREEKEDRHKDREDRHKDKEDKHKDKEDKHKDKEERHRDREERHKDKEERHRERRSKKYIETSSEDSVFGGASRSQTESEESENSLGVGPSQNSLLRRRADRPGAARYRGDRTPRMDPGEGEATRGVDREEREVTGGVDPVKGGTTPGTALLSDVKRQKGTKSRLGLRQTSTPVLSEEKEMADEVGMETNKDEDGHLLSKRDKNSKSKRDLDGESEFQSKKMKDGENDSQVKKAKSMDGEKYSKSKKVMEGEIKKSMNGEKRINREGEMKKTESIATETKTPYAVEFPARSRRRLDKDRHDDISTAPTRRKSSDSKPNSSKRSKVTTRARHSFTKPAKDEEGKENESPDVNGEKDDRIPRPTSAKGSRRRREGRRLDSDEEDESPARPQRDSNLQETDLPPQIMAARKQARPPSARPAPPRPKTDVTESEPTMRLGTGKPTNLIVDNDKDDEDDDDDNFLVEDSIIPPPEPEQPVEKKDGEEEEEHGGLVKKMLETKKELEQQPTPAQRKVDIERSAMSDAARRKQREQVQKEIDKLRTSIQGLTRSANPLGKIMDYVQEDLDSMQQELEKWKAENKEHAQSLKREKGVTDRAVEPLKAQLSELEQAIKDQLESSATVKANILRNDHKIDKMLKNIARSS